MSAQHAEGWNRRAFLGGLTLAGTAGLLGVPPRPVAAETPPETTRIRLVRTGSTCQAPQYLAEALLQSEGFSDVHYVPMAAGADGGTRKTLASGQYDPEDTVRFYALRLHEAGLIKSTPQRIIEPGTDWRFLHELKRELKG